MRSDDLTGLQMADPVPVDWSGKRSAPRTIRVQSGTWPSGLYAAKLEAPDGRVGFAPFVLRPSTPGPSRVAVVLPTNTWQAYNLYDADGDGWGDTWYAGGHPPVVLDRPYRARGVPPRFRRYDYPFLRWLEQTGRNPDFLTERRRGRARERRRAPAQVRPRRLPGTHRVRHGPRLRRDRALPRPGRAGSCSSPRTTSSGRWSATPTRSCASHSGVPSRGPESRLLGVQYRANDDGTRQAPFTMVDVDAAPWLFGDTGLANGSLARERGGRLRDRDRLDDVRVTAGHPGARADPRPVRPGRQRGDERTTRRARAQGCSRPARWTSPRCSSSIPASGCSTTSGATCSRAWPFLRRSADPSGAPGTASRATRQARPGGSRWEVSPHTANDADLERR